MERERIEEQAENMERILRGGRDKDPKRVAAGKRLAKWNKEERGSTPPQYFVVFGVVVYFLYIYFRGEESSSPSKGRKKDATWKNRAADVLFLLQD